MSRATVDFEQITAEVLIDLTFHEPARLVLPNPRRGGLSVAAVRDALSGKGRVRLSATDVRLFVDFDPGAPEPPQVALDTIVRNDAAGLERMLRTVLPHVDEIVLGVDSRSDEETLRVAEAYADCVYVFEAADIGMSLEDWQDTPEHRGKIDFAAARNLGRTRVHSPWTLVVDSDEFLAEAGDLRAKVAAQPPEVGGIASRVRMGGFEQKDDHQRLARTRYRWTSATHNQLSYTDAVVPGDVVVVCDTSLRDTTEQTRRSIQREAGMGNLVEEAAQGNLVALFHLAKHRSGDVDVTDAVRLVEDYRLRIEPHSVLSNERAWLALALAMRFFSEDNLPEADRWGVRALLDGPRAAAFCVLGDVAESQGDLERAQGWYECACALTDTSGIDWPGLTELRFGRLSGIRRALNNPTKAELLEVVDEV